MVVAIVAAGCGGGDADSIADSLTATPSDDAQQQTVADPAATSNEDIPGVNEIADADAAAGSTVTISSRTPKEFAKAHCLKPIVVVLYQPGAILDKKLYQAVRSGMVKSGVKDVVFIDYMPREVKAMGDLPSKLGLLSAPGLATVARNGKIENFWTSYVDDALIARSIQNAANTKPCRVNSNDVPAAGTTTSSLADAATVANGGTVSNTTTDPLAGTPPTTPTVEAAPASTM